MSSFARALGQYRRFARERLQGPSSLLAFDSRVQQLFDRADAKPIETPRGSGQLVRMAAPFDNQRLRDQIYGMVEGDAQPQVVVLAHGKRLVEPAHALE